MISKKIIIEGITKTQFVKVMEGGKMVNHLALIPVNKEGEDPCIYGCTDPNSVHPDEGATCDNGTCEYQANVGT